VREYESQMKELVLKKKRFKIRMKELESKEKVLESKEKHFESQAEELKSKERQLKGQVEELESKEKQLDDRVKEFELKKRDSQGRVMDLRRGTDGHTLTVKVVSSELVKTIYSNSGEVLSRTAECLVGDETGTIIFTARNEQGTIFCVCFLFNRCVVFMCLCTI
jgi:predicted RNase H-like nuclease (RuvC/YqgF family)